MISLFYKMGSGESKVVREEENENMRDATWRSIVARL